MPSWVARLLLLALCAGLPVAWWLILTGSPGQQSLYPEWSSLRSDQKGTSIWFESLRRDPYLRVERNFRPISEAHEPGITLILAGTRPNLLPGGTESIFSIAENAAKVGNRVIVAFDAEAIPTFQRPEVVLGLKKHGLNAEWRQDQLRLMPNAAWKTLRDEKRGPQTIERAAGKGWLVVVASSRALSNEGIAGGRDTGLLLTLTGSMQTILFDESHLGMVETGSIMGLARHYRLQGFLGGLLILCALFVWSNWAVFPKPVAAPQTTALGANPLDGLAGLLARALPEGGLIDECVRARAGMEQNARHRKALMEAANAGSSKDPVGHFQLIQAALSRKSKL